MLSTTHYSIDTIKDEVRDLVSCGRLNRLQPIYALCQFLPSREWICIECELEENGFLLRDRIVDLLGHEDWDND